MISRARLRWRCRRGMKELDLLLGDFLESNLTRLDETRAVTFERLLNHSDDELSDWLIHGTSPVDDDIARLVREIRGADGQGKPLAPAHGGDPRA